MGHFDRVQTFRGSLNSSRFSRIPAKGSAGLKYYKASQSSQRNFFHGKGSLSSKLRCQQKTIVAYDPWPESFASSLNKILYLDTLVDAATTQVINVYRLVI